MQYPQAVSGTLVPNAVNSQEDKLGMHQWDNTFVHK